MNGSTDDDVSTTTARDELVGRVRVLERRLKRQWLVLPALTAIAVAAGVATAPRQPEDLRATSLRIVDERGTVLGELGAGDAGARLLLHDTDGNAAVRIEIDRFGGVVRTFHPDGRPGARLRQYQLTATDPPVTGGMVEVFDHEGETAVVLGSGVDRGVSVSMGAGYDGGAVVVFRDQRPVHLTPPEESERRP